MTRYLIRVVNLVKQFPLKLGMMSWLRKEHLFVHAVDGVTFDILEGETFALVGETGSGKTTTSMIIARLIEPTSGSIFFDGKDISRIKGSELKSLRKDIQVIFQDPLSSLNPMKTVGGIITKQLKHYGIRSRETRDQTVSEVLEKVGLVPASGYVDRFPHEFSGGQQQRIGIARALVAKPSFVIADEPVSSLDISIRSQIINLLQDLKSRLRLTYLLISHDLSVVRYMADTVAVMYLGKIVETGRTRDVFEETSHPYTQALIDAVLVPNPSLRERRVKPRKYSANSVQILTGCRFHPRCPYAMLICRTTEPKPFEVGSGHLVACHSPIS